MRAPSASARLMRRAPAAAKTMTAAALGGAVLLLAACGGGSQAANTNNPDGTCTIPSQAGRPVLAPFDLQVTALDSFTPNAETNFPGSDPSNYARAELIFAPDCLFTFRPGYGGDMRGTYGVDDGVIDFAGELTNGDSGAAVQGEVDLDALTVSADLTWTYDGETTASPELMGRVDYAYWTDATGRQCTPYTC